ncbi:MAG: hypothetical protein KDB01_20950, partial [Planctomycetaceae bacterium]|nr:hypothetical protein [Planctomycetaceae bacterium]
LEGVSIEAVNQLFRQKGVANLIVPEFGRRVSICGILIRQFEAVAGKSCEKQIVIRYREVPIRQEFSSPDPSTN